MAHREPSTGESRRLFGRRAVAAWVGAGIAFAIAPSSAQIAANPPLVVFLSNFAPGDTRWNVDGFKTGLLESGVAVGRDMLLVLRYVDGRFDRLDEIAAEIVALRPSVIVASGQPAARALAKATTTIPIVLAVITDPIRLGMVRSYASPGGNVTGLVLQASELTPKRLELLREVAPSARRIGVLTDGAEGDAAGVNEALEAARALRFEGKVYSVRAPADFAPALDAMQRDGVEGLVVLPSPMLNANRRALIPAINRRRLPASYESRAFVEDGGLMSYGPSFTDMYRRSASFVVQILRGEKPAELPMQQPTRFELVISRRAAQDLRLGLPGSLLMRADEVLP